MLTMYMQSLSPCMGREHTCSAMLHAASALKDNVNKAHIKLHMCMFSCMCKILKLHEHAGGYHNDDLSIWSV